MKAINYWDYIKVEQLLALQGGFDNDERGINNESPLKNPQSPNARKALMSAAACQNYQFSLR
ncbi:hypothetical protein JH265_15025 [Xanthomonas campestris pv. campestris]|uniref:hypothetical protein n=1 Tax=Xanthomonas campestris TaxID=339 RepID=UPI002378083D|nr:hypothetical protein [Xanthomonas campestris]WDK40144.1 hypothetical protein JH312_15025 [Xanthomonas campestris pv. campestris]WDK44445.1 hypothetical protein JH265_15025 [Xanthomonas campestris pv. campestris]